MSYGYHGRQQKPRTEYKGVREASILRSTKEGWVLVSTPYDAKLVEDLKSWIEPSGRSWNPETKFWEVKEIHLGTLVTILKKHFGDNVTQNLTTPALGTGPKNMFIPVLEALKQLPNGQMVKVYRALANACHPDVGGTNELMSKLNQAYQEVKK